MTTISQLEPELWTKTDVAKWLQVSTRQVEILVKAKRIPPPVRLALHPRWRRTELLAFINGMTPDESGQEG